ncbi:hypothetical protein PINS_up016906 [Pythium insidiosum]|nr:hypothetical protein PINS_up016906 [Pythium insidiosum]
MRVSAVLASCAGVGALLAASPARAGPIYNNPVTGGTEELIPLGRLHPARGSPVPPDSLALQITVPTSADKRMRRALRNDNKSHKEDREGDSQVVIDDMARLEAHFKTKMVRNLKELEKHPTSEFSPAPWPASYWPIFQDGINFPWNYENDKQSPAEKYARAFGHDPKAFMDKISSVNGILSMKDHRACSTDQDCDSLRDGSACGKRMGEDKGRCVPRWFGICHAWAPAAIEEREPSCPVTKNNVTFQPVDIKALITQAYDGSHLATVFTGARFNGPDEPAKKDQDGRYVDPARRDLGAGFFHIAVHNIMGIHKKSCVVDVSSGAEVWNQPVRSYKVVKLEEMSPSEGMQRFFQKSSYSFNDQAKKVAYVQLEFRWVVEGVENGPLVSTGVVDRYTQGATYEYLLELDAQSNIIGGEWVNESREKHPDFLWFPAGKPSMNTVTELGLSYKEIRELLDASADCKELDKPSTPSPAPTSVAPVTTSPAPATQTPAPGTATPAPGATTPAPGATTPAPGVTTPAPATTAPAGSMTPAPTSGVPSPSSGGNQTPAPTTTKPAPTKKPDRPGQDDNDDDDDSNDDDGNNEDGDPAKPTPTPGKVKPYPTPAGGKGQHTPAPTPAGGKGKQTPAPTPAGGKGQYTPAPTSSGDNGKQTPAPTSSGDNGKQTPVPTPAGGKGQYTPAPTSSGDNGKQTPAPTSSGDNGKQTPAPTPAGGKGQYTPAPTSSGDNGKQTPAPTPAGGKGQYTPAPTSSGDNGKQTPAPTSSGDNGKQTPVPTPAGGKGQYTPAPTSSGDNGKQTPAPTSSGDNGKQTPVPTPAGGKGQYTPAPTSSGDNGKQTPAPTSSGDNGKQTPAPTPAGGKGQYTPAPTSSGDNGKQTPAPTPAGGKGQYTPAPTSSGDNGKQTPAPTSSGDNGKQTPAPTPAVTTPGSGKNTPEQNNSGVPSPTPAASKPSAGGFDFPSDYKPGGVTPKGPDSPTADVPAPTPAASRPKSKHCHT